MGMILPDRRVSADSSGNGRNGAKLRIYNANTTTLSSVYSDAALTTPLTNPVVANSSGVFPPIYAAEALYDITEQTSAGATIYSEDDVPAVGINSGSFERDFTNARVKISAAAGVVNWESGDPTGDDVGGKWRLGGWDETQATTGELDAAATTVTGTLAVSGATALSSTLNVTGLITENSKKLPGVVYTEGTFSAASTVDIPLTNTPTGVRGWEIEIIDLVSSHSTNISLRARLAYDATPTFKTGGTDYAYQEHTSYNTTPTAFGDNQDTFIELGYIIYLPSAYPGLLRTHIITPNSGSAPTVIQSQISGWTDQATDYPIVQHSTGYGLGGYGRATYLRLYADNGNLTGRYRVVPKRGFGE